MFQCDVCGTFNFKENNYCIHCGNELIMENICPKCNQLNTDSASFCINCGNPIKPLVIDDYDILFSKDNENLLKNANISDKEYNQILREVFLRAEYSSVRGKSARDKIINFASNFTSCKPKSRGMERGFNFGKFIFYDDRLDESVQIATIIHELAHYLLFRIIETLLCKIFNINSSKTLQSFVWYYLTLPHIAIANEYCAHTVEGRFIPHGYQNYSSFNELVDNADLDIKLINKMMVIGNTFANELIVYLEKYIDSDFRKSIKLQYKKDLKSPSYDSISLETQLSVELSVKNELLVESLLEVFKKASNENTREELEFIKKGI